MANSVSSATSPTSVGTSREQQTIFNAVVKDIVSSLKAHTYFSISLKNRAPFKYVDAKGVQMVIDHAKLQLLMDSIIKIIQSLKDLFKNKITRKNKHGMSRDEYNLKRSTKIIQYFNEMTQDVELAGAVVAHILKTPKKNQQFPINKFITDNLVNYFFDAETRYGCGSCFLLTANSKGAQSLITREEAKSDDGLEYAIQKHGDAMILSKIRGETGKNVTIAGLRALSNVKNMIAIIGQDHIAPVGLVVSLLSLIISVNDLQSQSVGQRIHYDNLFLKYFGTGQTSEWVYNGVVLNTINQDLPNNKSDKVQSITDRLRFSGLSPLQRIADLKDVTYNRKNATGQPKTYKSFIAREDAPGSDDWGYLYAGNITLATSMLTIPNEVLSTDLYNYLVENKLDNDAEKVRKFDRVMTSMVIQDYLKQISNAHRKLNPKKKATTA